MIKKIEYVHEPDDLQCGQAVLAMVTGIPVSEVSKMLDNRRETTLKEMKCFLSQNGYKASDERIQVKNKNELPRLCILSLETPRCWHWSLYCDGVFYDPEHGVMEEFPVCKRKYYWNINRKDEV